MKIPKFTMQLYSFIYDCLMDFPATKFDEIKTVTTRGFLGKNYKILNAKVHLHHSHVSGEKHGYSHDYCNGKSRENKQYVPLIGHNFLGFDIFIWLKVIDQYVGEQQILTWAGQILQMLILQILALK